MSDEIFDPIDLELLWNRLILIADEAAYAIVRTSMSKVVVEGRDFGALLLDPQGRLLGADVSIASKTGTISIAVKELLKIMPLDSFHPGDMVVTNNPWWIMGHLNDIAIIAPLFYRGRVVGFAECMAHMADIGGSLSGMPREVYEEGLIIPPLKIVEKGQENPTFFSMLEANVRVPATDCRGCARSHCRLPGDGAHAVRIPRPSPARRSHHARPRNPPAIDGNDAPRARRGHRARNISWRDDRRWLRSATDHPCPSDRRCRRCRDRL